MVTEFTIYDIIIICSISFISAFSIALNNFAKDKDKNINKTPLLYLSESFISGLCGLFIAMAAMNFFENKLIWFISSGIGGFSGRRLLFVIVKLFIVTVANSKNLDLDKLHPDNNEDNESSE